jgi:fructose-1,6-bisphosphatase/inositol monophosphatase family enzyme
MLVVNEAGGDTTNHRGAPLQLHHRDSVCSSGGVHDELITAMANLPVVSYAQAK